MPLQRSFGPNSAFKFNLLQQNQKHKSATGTQSSAACCGLSPVLQATPDLQEEPGCVRSCPYRQTRIPTPIWDSSDASGTLGATGHRSLGAFRLRWTVSVGIATFTVRPDLAKPLQQWPAVANDTAEHRTLDGMIEARSCKGGLTNRNGRSKRISSEWSRNELGIWCFRSSRPQ